MNTRQLSFGLLALVANIPIFSMDFHKSNLQEEWQQRLKAEKEPDRLKFSTRTTIFMALCIAAAYTPCENFRQLHQDIAQGTIEMSGNFVSLTPRHVYGSLFPSLDIEPKVASYNLNFFTIDLGNQLYDLTLSAVTDCFEDANALTSTKPVTRGLSILVDQINDNELQRIVAYYKIAKELRAAH